MVVIRFTTLICHFFVEGLFNNSTVTHIGVFMCKEGGEGAGVVFFGGIFFGFGQNP